MIWKTWKKSKLNSEKIWKIRKNGQVNNGDFWKIWKTSILKSEMI